MVGVFVIVTHILRYVQQVCSRSAVIVPTCFIHTLWFSVFASMRRQWCDPVRVEWRAFDTAEALRPSAFRGPVEAKTCNSTASVKLVAGPAQHKSRSGMHHYSNLAAADVTIDCKFQLGSMHSAALMLPPALGLLLR